MEQEPKNMATAPPSDKDPYRKVGPSACDVVGFVVLTWNSRAYVDSCIRSILGISSRPVELYVVDNGSSDGTVDALRSWARRDPRVWLHEAPRNLGTTVSRNIALKALSEDVGYVCVLDSDTVVNEAAIEALIALVDSDPLIGIAGPTMQNSSGAVQLSGRNLPTLGIKLRKACPIASVSDKGDRMELPSSPVTNGTQDVGYLLSACWLMKRDTLEKVGLLDERIFYAPEDVDYCIRARQAGYRVVRCFGATIMHEYQRISRKRLLSKVNLEHVKGLAYFFKKHGYLFDARKATCPGGSI